MNILVAGPHPDDQELGMGGTIARLVAEGHRVLLLDLTDGEPTPFGDRATRAREAAEAARILGAERTTLDLPNRTLVHSVEARHRVAAVIRGFRPEVMFVPYFEDAHPDHVAGTRIVEDARFDAKLTKTDLPGDPWHAKWLFHYYATHLRIVPQPSFLMDTSGLTRRGPTSAAASAPRPRSRSSPASRSGSRASRRSRGRCLAPISGGRRPPGSRPPTGAGPR
jgi:LmbE family N-acetylglucosaminyl deacetylase